MAFTPSFIRPTSIGALTLTIAETNGAVAAASDSWASGITNIVGIFPVMNVAPTVTPTNIAVSWTASSGTIWVVREAANTATAFVLYVLSGLGQRV